MFVPIAAIEEMSVPTAPVGATASSEGTEGDGRSARTGAVLGARIVP